MAKGNVAVVARYLRNKGLSPAQVAGVIGSMQGESGQGLSPTATNPGPDHAFGIAQWLGGRKAALMKRPNPTSIKTQLDHLWSELQGPERAALASLRRAHTPEQAAIAWQRDFERGAPFEQKYDMRAKNARNVFNSIKNLPSSARAGSTEGSTDTTTVTTPSITIGAGSRTVEDPEAQKRVILANLLKQRDPQSLLLKLGVLDPNEPTTKTVDDPGVTIPGTTSTSTTNRKPSVPSTGGGTVKGGKSPLFELIHKGDQPYAVKNGRKVDKSVFASVWDGHANHVHVAAGPNTIVKLGKLAQRMGLHVGENPHFGGVTAVHVPGSYHYKGEAIDVSGDPRKMNQYSKRVERIYGLG